MKDSVMNTHAKTQLFRIRKTGASGLLVFVFALFCGLVSSCGAQAQQEPLAASLYEFKVPGLLGDTIDFAEFKGKKVLIVNTASRCGHTPQYEGLEKLYKQYQQDLVIVGFPSNDFGKQEPGSAEEIAAFCQKNYGVSFPMAAKTKVKGEEAAPLYAWLSAQGASISCPAKVRWNFHKFLIDEQGKLIACFPSKVDPLSAEILDLVKK